MTNAPQGRDQPSVSVKPAPAWLGRRVGSFKLLAIIGQGAMGRVFRAEDINLNRLVALKVLPSKTRIGDTDASVEQFIREARSAATLEHPHVVHIYEVNQIDKIWYIAMELLEGGNLRELVKANGPLDMPRACQLGAEAADALDFAHRAGIVHRDIKPANLMLTRSGRCKLTDFGLARIDDANDSFHMQTESVGTPLYVAPEVTDGRPATGASDIYSLGCTLFYLLTGQPPFFATTAAEVIEMHRTAPPPDLCALRPELPASLSQAIARAMAKEPEERYESADVLAKVLRMHTIAVGGSGSGIIQPGIPAYSSGPFQPPPPAHKSSNRLLIVGSCVAVSVVGLGIFFAVFFASHAQTNVTIQTSAPVLAATPAPEAPPAVNAPPVVAPPPVEAAVAAGDVTIQASDSKKLFRIADGTDKVLAGHPVIVVGTIASVHSTTGGKMIRIDFVGANTDDGFCAVYPPAMAEVIQSRLATAPGGSVVGRKVSVTGVPVVHKTRSEIRIDSVDQIELLK